MDDRLSRLFEDFDRGLLSRRSLLKALGATAMAAPMAAFGQGQCGGDRKGTPECDTKPFPDPFKPTGWKTVLLDHFSLQVVDLEKEAAYYNALMGWKVRSYDGKLAVLDMGTIGSVKIRGGLVVPPAPPAPATPPPAPANAEARGGRGGVGGRGGGGGGRGGTPPRAVWDNFCWGITPWDTKKVEAELKSRNLNPVADHDPKTDFFSFHVKDPDGFDLQISNGNKKNRRTKPANAELGVKPPFEPTGWQTAYLDHISFGVTSYKETVAFYRTLLGWIPGGDEGSQDETTVNTEFGGLIIRGGNANAPGGLRGARGQDPNGPLVRRASMGHIAFGILNFDPDKVNDALMKRGLSARVDTGGGGDIHTANYKSYHTTTPNGYDLQISAKIKA